MVVFEEQSSHSPILVSLPVCLSLAFLKVGGKLVVLVTLLVLLPSTQSNLPTS